MQKKGTEIKLITTKKCSKVEEEGPAKFMLMLKEVH
jgi:hypothetical protein